MRSVQVFCLLWCSGNFLFVNLTVSPQATITDGPYKGRHHLGVASNDFLFIALAIEYKRCHLPTNNLECNNSPSLVSSTQLCNNLEREAYDKFNLDILEIFSKTTVDIHYTKHKNYA